MRGGAMLYVVVTALVLAVGASAMLRMVSVGSRTVSRAEEAAIAEGAIDSVFNLVRSQAASRTLTLPSFPTLQVGDASVTAAVTDNSAVLGRTVLVSAAAVVRGRTYRRSEVLGIPLPPEASSSEAQGLWGVYSQTDGTNSWFRWPPAIIRPRHLQRADTFFEFGSGATMSFVPGAPSPFVVWTGSLVVPTTGTYSFSVSADNNVSLWIGGVNQRDTFATTFQFDGFRGGPSSRSLAFNWTAGQVVPIRLVFMDYGIVGSFRFRWRTPGASADVPVPASVMVPSTFVGGARRTWSIPIDPRAVYSTATAGDAVRAPTPIDLQSLGFLPGDRIRLRMVGSANNWAWPENNHVRNGHMTGILSRTPSIDANVTVANRVPGVVRVPGMPDVANHVRETAHDFVISNNWDSGSGWSRAFVPVEFTIPAEGRYLFAQVHDSWWGDNRVGHDGLYNIIIERP